MPSLWFVVPVRGRAELAAICLRQLRRTCDALTRQGIEATAVVVGDDENLETAEALGFGTVTRDNQFLSRKFNDGIQLACDPEVNPRPADYIVPCGSDDWVDHRILLELPGPDTMVGFQHCSFVRPDAGEIILTHLRVQGGCGIRIYPRQLLASSEYRPADEDRYRACDTSIITNVRARNERMSVAHRLIDPRQIVDWKSPAEQVTGYDAIGARHGGERYADPFATLAELWPDGALDEMRAHYSSRVMVAA